MHCKIDGMRLPLAAETSLKLFNSLGMMQGLVNGLIMDVGLPEK
jgi:hypothetical protein